MRDLTRPHVLKCAAAAALATAIGCLPHLCLWSHRAYPILYLEAVLFTGAIVLWGFVFAWHTKYTGRPVFTLNLKAGEIVLTTLAGIVVAAALRLFVDPLARQAMPGDYPANLEQWLGRSLFTLFLNQLFLVFAPFAWLMRLLQKRAMAFALTVLFGLGVLALQTRLLPSPHEPVLITALVITRLTLGIFSLAIYLRGGVLLTWWWGLVIQLRFLPV